MGHMPNYNFRARKRASEKHHGDQQVRIRGVNKGGGIYLYSLSSFEQRTSLNNFIDFVSVRT